MTVEDQIDPLEHGVEAFVASVTALVSECTYTNRSVLPERLAESARELKSFLRAIELAKGG